MNTQLLGAILLLFSADEKPPQFRLSTLVGEPVVTSLKALTSSGELTTDEMKQPAGSWYALRQIGKPLPPWPTQPHLQFANGDRLCGTLVELDSDALRWRMVDGETILRFPLSALTAIWFTPSTADAETPAWLSAPRAKDIVHLKSGELLTVALSSISEAPKIVKYQLANKEAQTELAKVSALGFNTDLVRVRLPKGSYYRLTLRDGSRLNALTLQGDERVLKCETLFKQPFSLLWSDILAVDVEQGSVRALVDLKPTQYEYRSFAGEQFSWLPNLAVTGKPLRLATKEGEATFVRGLGLHAECSLRYEFAQKYRRFEAVVGLDSQSGKRGQVVLEISIDGKPQTLPNNGKISSATGLLSLRLEVANAKEMTIQVKAGAGGNVQDHVNIVEARLVP